MNAVGESEYAHRENADGTFDSICLRCFQTIISANSELELVESERMHSCTSAVAYTNGRAEGLEGAG
jgi:hypothetical protein